MGIRLRSCASVLTFASLSTIISITGAGVVPVNAVGGVFDPSIGATSQPILVRGDGDVIPVDASGIGGAMLDRLPTDPRTAIERHIESDIADALNAERTTRGLVPLQLSDNLSAIDHRFVEQMVSDADDYPQCPRVATSESCDAANPSFDWSQFINPFNGDLDTFTRATGGSLQGADDIRPGDFVNRLMASDTTRAAVLTTRATHIGVGVRCGEDGRTYMVWDAGAFDPSVVFAEPDAWQGEYAGPVNTDDFGARCPQPGPTFATTSDASGALTVTLTSVVAVTPCRSIIGGTVLAGQTSARAQLSRDGVVVDSQIWPPYSTTGFAPHTFTSLPPGVYTVTVDGFDECETTLSSTADQVVVDRPPPPGGARFRPVAPIREVDTRSARGGSRVDGTEPVRLVLPDVPSDAVAVTGNLTIVEQSGAGYATLYPCDGLVPRTSTVNYVAGQTTPNQFTIAVADSTICLLSSQAVDVVIDLQGVWVPDPAGAELIAASARLWDTRTQDGVDDHVLILPLHLPTDASLSGLRGVSLNITADHAAAPGFVSVWPCASPRPVVSSLNPSGATAANLVTLILPSDDPRVCIYASQRVELVVDLVGWWATGTGVHHLVGKMPIRALDSRLADWPLLAGIAQHVMPARPGTAVLNVTAVDAKAPGYIAIYSCGTGYDGTSTVNFVATQGISNAALVDSTTGVCAISSTRVQFVIDDLGSIQ